MIPPSRLVRVVTDDCAATTRVDDPGRSRCCVLPRARGTAPETLMAALRIVQHDPDAILAVLPADHLIQYGPRLVDYVAKAAAAAAGRADLPVLVGAYPGSSDPEYAWIEPGEPVDGLESLGVHAVERFLVRPSPDERTGLFHTAAIVATAAGLLAAARRFLPEVMECLEPLADAADAAWASMPTASLCADVLALLDELAMISMPHAMMGERSRPLVSALAS